MIDHLRVEWSVNPQYGYGWAVPFLCGYLAWRRWRSGVAGGSREAGNKNVRGWVLGVVFAGLAVLYLPTRLVEEANPEWRLVSWGLVVEVVGITWMVVRGWEAEMTAGRGRREACPALGRAVCGFPLWFFLVAVPWPTVIEGPLTQALGQAIAGVAVEVLNLAGVPALQHGNVIEVGRGWVGIDEACSGIRSLQATVMMALFFGEVYRLSLKARALCVLAGAALAFVFNVARTTALTWVAARQGAPAMERWHDPAGVSILLGCFVSLWLIARGCRLKVESCRLNDAHFQPSTFNLQPFGVMFAIWLLLVELATAGWYGAHERRLAAPVTWRIEVPRGWAGYRELGMSEKARRMLRYDEAINVKWNAESGAELQAIFLRWKPGRAAVHLARSHTPKTCLTAMGHELVGAAARSPLAVCGLEMPFKRYRFEEPAGPVFVFYCLWEDRVPGTGFDVMGLNWANRLGPVVAGRRNCGQRSLELAVRGAEGEEEAEEVVRKELEGIIRR